MPNTILSTLRSGVRSETKLDKRGKIWDDQEVDEAIGLAIEEIEAKGNYKFPGNQVSISFDSIVDQQDYDMEANIPNFQGIDLVKYDGRVIMPTKYDVLVRNYKEFISGTPINYYTYGGNLGLHPYPSSVKSIYVMYTKFLTLPVEDTDTSPLPVAFDKAIKLFAAYTLLAQPGDNKNLGRAASKLQMFKKQMSKLYNAYLLPDRENMVYKSSYVPRASRGRVTNPNQL